MKQTTISAERDKYERMWATHDYNASGSPGEQYVDLFVDIAQPEARESLLDIGCGRGGAGLAFRHKHHLSVSFLDLVDGGLLQPFHQQAVWQAFPNRVPPWDYGYCCDVMEHIPIDYVALTLERIRAACTHSFFSISNVPDNCGKLIGEILHLTVMPYQWWLAKMEEIGSILDARDFLHTSIFYVRHYP